MLCPYPTLLRSHRGLDHELRGSEIDGRVGFIEMQARRDAALRQRQRGLDHASRAGGNHQVADVALGRSEATEAGVRSLASERLRQSLDLDRSAQRRGGAVCLVCRPEERRVGKEWVST